MSERMSNALGLLFMLVLVLLFVVALVWGIWKQLTTKEFEPQTYAAEHGWLFTQERVHEWTLRPATGGWWLGVRQQALGGNRSVKDLSGQTLFLIERTSAQTHGIFLSPQPPAFMRGPETFEWMKSLAGQFTPWLGELPSLMARSQLLPTGNTAFDAQFALATTDAGFAHMAVSQPVQQRLLRFVKETGIAPSLVWQPGHLSVSIPENRSPQVVQALVALGLDMQAFSRE